MEGVIDLSWHPDSRRIVLACDSGRAIRILNIDGQTEFEQTFDGSNAMSVAWNHAGSQFAVGYKTPWANQPNTAIEIRQEPSASFSML